MAKHRELVQRPSCLTVGQSQTPSERPRPLPLDPPTSLELEAAQMSSVLAGQSHLHICFLCVVAHDGNNGLWVWMSPAARVSPVVGRNRIQSELSNSVNQRQVIFFAASGIWANRVYGIKSWWLGFFYLLRGSCFVKLLSFKTPPCYEVSGLFG